MTSEIRVPLLDVAATYGELKSEVDGAIQRVMDSGVFVLGQEVEAFESEFATYVDATHCVGVANGLEALRLALRAVGVERDAEVIVPGHTFIATWLAVSQCGARVVPVDAEINGFNIDPTQIEERISSRTRAIIIVHLYGHPADIDAVRDIAHRYQIPIVEDAAQAHGARYRSVRIGAHSSAVAWSFYPSKNLGAFGDAGAITTNSAEIAERVRVQSNYGAKVKYQHVVKGDNSRLDPIQAAILGVKLPALDRWNSRRGLIADLYTRELSSSDRIELPTTRHYSDPVWHLYVVQVPKRDVVRALLLEQGVETGVHYPTPPHLQYCYRDELYDVKLRRTTELSQKVLSLPIGPHLTIEQAGFVAKTLRTTVDTLRVSAS